MPLRSCPPFPGFALRLALGVALPAALAGCAGPLDRTAEQELRESLIAQHRQRLSDVAAGPVIVEREPSEVEQQLSPERRALLDRISGVDAYENLPLDVGPDLLGNDQVQIVRIGLQEAIDQAVSNNLDLAIARLGPAIARQQVIRAQAAFDTVLFANADWSKLDTPQPPGAVPGLSGDVQEETLSVGGGLRKPLYSGGELSIETAIAREERTPSFFGVPSFYNADVLASLRQPLLRGFGEQVNRAQIFLAQNAQLAEVEELRANMLDLAFSTEAAYWDLTFARQRLLIQLRLLQRTIDDRDRLALRRDFDVSQVRLTEANSFVELRRAEVIRARQALRSASDQLKELINAADLPVAGETLLLPSDDPVEQPIQFSLVNAVATALRYRPELETALLRISDAGIRQRVADNAKLPILDLAAAVGLNGLDVDDAGGAYDNLADADYIDYLISGQFEYPLGNRAAEALYTQRRLERREAVLAYRDLAQERVLAVKDALRDVMTSYQLIGAARAARRAAADSLRAIEEQEEAGVALTPEFLLDLKLQTQQRLADAETQEIQAVTDYNTAIARFYQSIGTLLKRKGIVFEPMP